MPTEDEHPGSPKITLHISSPSPQEDHSQSRLKAKGLEPFVPLLSPEPSSLATQSASPPSRPTAPDSSATLPTPETLQSTLPLGQRTASAAPRPQRPQRKPHLENRWYKPKRNKNGDLTISERILRLYEISPIPVGHYDCRGETLHRFRGRG